MQNLGVQTARAVAINARSAVQVRPHIAVRSVRLALASVVISIMLAGCFGDDDNSNNPSPTTAPTLTGSTGQVTSDGICKATIPIDWAESGTGHGTTANGASYVLFGGKVANDEAWKQAVQLALDRAAKVPNAQVTQGDDFVRTMNPDDKGLDYRGRYDGVYCDFSVTSNTRALTDQEKSGFESAVASLGPAA
jgi:hypothetical protein